MKKSYKFNVKSFDVQTGEIEGYANTFNFKDYAGDITMPGAFTKCLEQHKRNGTVIKMLWQHQPENPIGVWTEGYEDEKGLYLKGKLILGVQKADEAALLLAAGAIDGLSIGYEVIDEEYSYKEDANLLHELNCYEVSVVTHQCNAESKVESVKSKSTPRELEKQLRSMGMSQKNAKSFVSKALKELGEDEDQMEQVEVTTPEDVMEILTAIAEAIPVEVLAEVTVDDVTEVFEEALDEIVSEEKRKARKARKEEPTDNEGDTVLDEIMEILAIVDSKNSKNDPENEILNTDVENTTPPEDDDFLKSLQSLLRKKSQTGRSQIKNKLKSKIKSTKK